MRVRKPKKSLLMLIARLKSFLGKFMKVNLRVRARMRKLIVNLMDK